MAAFKDSFNHLEEHQILARTLIHPKEENGYSSNPLAIVTYLLGFFSGRQAKKFFHQDTTTFSFKLSTNTVG